MEAAAHKKKTKRTETDDPNASGAKKPRKKTKKVKGDEEFLPTTDEERRLLDINYPLDECFRRLHVNEFVKETSALQEIPKINIAITKDFVMTIQNVVMTVALECKPRTANKLDAYGSSSSSSSLIIPLPARTHEAATTYQPPPPTQSVLIQPLRVVNTNLLSSVAANHLSLDDLINHELDHGEDEPRAPGDAAAAAASPAMTRQPYYIPLDQLTYYWRHYGAQHNNRRFTAVILRSKMFNAASLAFSSGNFVCTGCSRSELALWLLNATLEKLRMAGFDNFEMPSPKLRNIVSSGRFPNRICTNLLAVTHSDCCRRAEKFPGTMISHPDMGDRVGLAFDSGKFCLSGDHDVDEIKHDVRVLYGLLTECQYTVKNKKLDDECARILDMTRHSPQRDNEIKQLSTRITAERDAHRRQIQEKRSKTAQARALKKREGQQHATTSLLPAAPNIVLSSDEEEDDEEE